LKSDHSRQRSLIFALRSSANRLGIVGEKKGEILLGNLNIEDIGQEWLISSSYNDLTRSITRPKSNFQFYVVKNQRIDSEDIGKLNQQAFDECVTDLFSKFGFVLEGRPSSISRIRKIKELELFVIGFLAITLFRLFILKDPLSFSSIFLFIFGFGYLFLFRVFSIRKLFYRIHFPFLITSSGFAFKLGNNDIDQLGHLLFAISFLSAALFLHTSNDFLRAVGVVSAIIFFLFGVFYLPENFIGTLIRLVLFCAILFRLTFFGTRESGFEPLASYGVFFL
jgi:hypothetical protein